MKTVCVVGVLLLAGMIGSAEAQIFQSVKPDQAQLLQSGPGQLYCPNCGMNLVKFFKTSHALTLPGGQTHQYCSLHCLVEANPGSLAGAKVVDGGTLEFVEAPEATYVVGSSKPGTMTMKSKYAFADQKAAAAFAKANGGEIMDFAAAAAIARSGLAMENQKIDAKRGKMALKGQKIFAGMCQGVELPDFQSIAAAKTYLAESEACGPLQDDQLQAVALFLMRRESMADGPAAGIAVPDQAKCPVCGMFVAKYPKWAALVEAADGQKFYFDGVKDMMKFLFDPAAYHVKYKTTDFTGMVVTDYYTLEGIPAETAFFVVGSNVFGPMGNELIPFATKKDALVFLEDHAASTVVPFAEITPDLVRELDR